MGKSCIYYDETFDSYQTAMDNLLMAKKLYDLGIKLPQNYVFTSENSYEREASFFLFGLELLTCCEPDIIEDDGDEYSFILEIPEAAKWKEIEGEYPEAKQDREWICEPIANKEFWCEFTDVQVNVEVLPGIGLSIQVYGMGCYFSVFEKICDYFFRLREKVAVWSERGEQI